LITHVCIPKFGRGIFEDIRKKLNLLAKACPGVLLENRERKNYFVKHNIS
jgi:hypothetical protein